MINITFNGVGNLVTDPETITANNGQNVTSFRFACNGRDRTKTTFLKINAWNNIGATIEKYAKKGSRMYLGGDMTINEYKTSAGENRISMEVTVNRFEFISLPNPLQLLPLPRSTPRRRLLLTPTISPLRTLTKKWRMTTFPSNKSSKLPICQQIEQIGKLAIC